MHPGAVAVTLRCAPGTGTCQATATMRDRTSDGRTGDDTFISATVHREVWIYSFQVWSQTQSFTTARRIFGTTPIRVFPASAGPRNGGPHDTTARSPNATNRS